MGPGKQFDVEREMKGKFTSYNTLETLMFLNKTLLLLHQGLNKSLKMYKPPFLSLSSKVCAITCP